jgi:hypothetical protein
MQRKISPAIKGLITAILMIAVAIAIFYSNPGNAMQLQYIIYIIYALTGSKICFPRDSNASS